MSKFDTVIYTEKSLTDKIIAGIHPTFKSCVKIGVSTVPSIAEIRQYLPKKKIAFLGGFFSHLYLDVSQLCDECTFILRDEDEIPNTDKIYCSIEQWHNYWCQLPQSNGPMMKSLYDYTYRYADLDQRIWYEGLLSFDVLKMTPTQLILFFNNLPIAQEIQKAGKNRMNFMRPIISTRIQFAKVDKNLKLVFTTGDCFQVETCSSLLENFPECQVACCLYQDYSKNKLCGFLISKGNNCSAVDIAKLLFENFTGSKFIANGHSSKIENLII